MGLQSISHVVSRKTTGSIDGVLRKRLILISRRINTENCTSTAIHYTQGHPPCSKQNNWFICLLLLFFGGLQLISKGR
ncbi:hypothetical protein LOK49_LG08G01327 [Camellia lanceoleosa]|uniref:Uncharacterized protein n=1 Tax=Camellia lanceoleosa TaxID=1840588 RepID=A0ACC0GTN9_9ERIC|nr:hypothetical protein LOK49_LG08G01327 [Camellia lanceoleosa]